MPTVPVPRRRWFRFSLRTLLIFTVLIGALMGWIVRIQRLAAEQREIWCGNCDFEGTYEWERRGEQGPKFVPNWIVDALGKDFFGNVVQIHLKGYRMQRETFLKDAEFDEAMFNLKKFPQLDTVVLPDFLVSETQVITFRRNFPNVAIIRGEDY